jgi:glycosyltransferase involved in cell wall biosynthesis
VTNDGSLDERWILQICHGYSGPFLDVARQYAALFCGSPFRISTVYLVGDRDEQVRAGSASDEVIFLGHASQDIRELKIKAIRSVGKIATTHRYDMVIAHRFKPIHVACLATRLPVIGVHHAFGDYERPRRRWFAHLFRKRLALLAVSDSVRDDLRGCLPAWAPERIETLHNRLDLDAVCELLFPRERARLELDLPQDAPVIANVGRLHPDKDQSTLIDGFARALPSLPSGTLLVIAGRGTLENRLIAQVQALGISGRVRFLGQIPDARRYFRAFDLFVLSSDHEPFGMVLLEAMAANVAVLATGCGGAPEVVANPAQLFPLNDAETLAGKLAEFMVGNDAGERRRACAETGRERLDSFFSDETARRRFFDLPMVRAILAPPEGNSR